MLTASLLAAYAACAARIEILERDWIAREPGTRLTALLSRPDCAGSLKAKKSPAACRAFSVSRTEPERTNHDATAPLPVAGPVVMAMPSVRSGPIATAGYMAVTVTVPMHATRSVVPMLGEDQIRFDNNVRPGRR